ncbi:MAG: hypothetical protein ABI114_09205 [Rhodanobacter sp.]
MTPFSKRGRWLLPLLLGVCALAPMASALAWQSVAPPKAVAPVLRQSSPQVQFQQVVQQQQVRDQLQKSQMQQQLQQGVSDTAKRPLPADSAVRKQTDSADKAREERERARQKDLLERYQNAAAMPVTPTDVNPPSARSGH